MPPARGNITASSATVSAPHSAITAPPIQSSAMPPSPPASAATVLGTRKMPLPMTEPTSTAAALQTPSRRGSVAGVAGASSRGMVVLK